LRENINPEVSKKLDFNPVVAACNGGVKSAAQDIIVVADASAVGETGYCRDMLDLNVIPDDNGSGELVAECSVQKDASISTAAVQSAVSGHKQLAWKRSLVADSPVLL